MIGEACRGDAFRQRPPPVVGFDPDKEGNHKILIIVAAPSNENLVKGFLLEFIKSNFIKVDEGNYLFKFVCDILKIDFTPFNVENPAEIKASDNLSQLKDAAKIMASGSVQRLMSPRQLDAPKKEKNDDDDSEDTGFIPNTFL